MTSPHESRFCARPVRRRSRRSIPQPSVLTASTVVTVSRCLLLRRRLSRPAKGKSFLFHDGLLPRVKEAN